MGLVIEAIGKLAGAHLPYPAHVQVGPGPHARDDRLQDLHLLVSRPAAHVDPGHQPADDGLDEARGQLDRHAGTCASRAATRSCSSRASTFQSEGTWIVFLLTLYPVSLDANSSMIPGPVGAMSR